MLDKNSKYSFYSLNQPSFFCIPICLEWPLEITETNHENNLNIFFNARLIDTGALVTIWVCIWSIIVNIEWTKSKIQIIDFLLRERCCSDLFNYYRSENKRCHSILQSVGNTEYRLDWSHIFTLHTVITSVFERNALYLHWKSL